MAWDVEYTDEFGSWWESLDEDEQAAVDASVSLLGIYGPALSRPHADHVKGSRHANMKELRTQHKGEALPHAVCVRPQADRHSTHRREQGRGQPVV